jgi:hypothetical protein
MERKSALDDYAKLILEMIEGRKLNVYMKA